MFYFDGANRSNGTECVRVQVNVCPVSGDVEIELSNMVSKNGDEDWFEEAVVFCPKQFRVFVAALKALGDEL